MATNFIEIYSRAMTMIKSPVLSRLQSNDTYSFCMVMEEYLKTAITYYNPNEETYKRVSAYTDSEYGEESFTGDGATTAFVLTTEPYPTSESIFKVLVNDTDTTEYSYDEDTHTITFTTAPIADSTISIAWGTTGSFSSITGEDITLLAMATCLAWAIQTQNNQLDIDRQPRDTDFNLHAEGTTLNAKVDWVKHFEEMYKRELSKADWRPTFRGGL